jgi:Na+/alanine symporter
MWTIFQIVALFAAGSVIVFGGEVDGRAISVSVFLGIAALVVWLASSWTFSKLIELVRSMYRRRLEFSGPFDFNRTRNILAAVSAKVGTSVSRTISGVAVAIMKSDAPN